MAMAVSRRILTSARTEGVESVLGSDGWKGLIKLCVLTGFTIANLIAACLLCIEFVGTCSEGQSSLQAGQKRLLGNSCIETSWLL